MHYTTGRFYREHFQFAPARGRSFTVGLTLGTFGGAEDSLPGSAAIFRQRMRFVAERIPNGLGRLHLIPGLGHVPHLEAPEKTYPPLIAFLEEGL